MLLFMKKSMFLLFGFVCFFAFSQTQAQTSQSSTKDEYWGTSKAQTKGSAVDAVGRRASGLDTRFNTYENDSRRKAFEKDRIRKSKRMKEILKKEKKMMKKHKRDKRRLERRRRH